MNNKGQAGLYTVVGILFLVILGGLGYVGYNSFVSQSVTGSDGDTSGVNVDCEIAPSYAITVTDAINRGTTVSSTTNTYVVEGQLRGTSPSLKVGESGEILIAKTNYIDEVVPFEVTSCGATPLGADMYATSTNTFRAFNTNGNPLTDNIIGGATNQSQSAAPISIDLRIDSTSDESTGDLIIVVEVDNTTEVDSIKLSGAGASDATTPEFYSPAAAGSIVDTFEVPALLDGESKQLTLTLAPESGQTIGIGATGVYVTAYSKQAFIDVDGTTQVGVEDADGNTKYEDTWDFDFMIN